MKFYSVIESQTQPHTTNIIGEEEKNIGIIFFKFKG